MPLLIRLVVLVSGWASPAFAAGFDEPYVGGLFGSPTATNASAVWWNPGGLAAARGTRFLVDLGPSFRRLTIDRAGLPRPALETFADTSLVPFVGLASDFGVRRLGVGFALFVPQAQRWQSDRVAGPNRFALRTNDFRVLQLSLGGAYEFWRVLSIGVSASIVDGRWRWSYDEPVVDAIAAGTGTGTFDDEALTDPNYAATTTFDLEDQAATFAIGFVLKPGRRSRASLAASYHHSARLDHQGLARLDFGCPPEDDVAGRASAEAQGLCDASVDGFGSFAMRLPSRAHVGFEVRPVQGLRIEVFGTWVGWSQLRDVRIGTTVNPEAIGGETPDTTATALSGERPRAIDGRDSFSAAIDVKAALTPQFTLGARAGFEQAAIPVASMSALRADSDTVRLAGLGLFRPFRALEVGVSYSRDLAWTREVDTSAFGLSLEPDRAPRYRYVESRGRYAFFAQRVGVVVKGRLGTGPSRPAR